MFDFARNILLHFIIHHIVLQETLKLMGVRSSMQMLSWFTEYFLIMCCIVCLITVVLSYPCEVASITAYGQRIVKPYYSAIIGGNSPFVLFFFLIAYSLSVITFSFAVSAFCTQGDHHIVRGA